jgi:hypothetical protein
VVSPPASKPAATEVAGIRGPKTGGNSRKSYSLSGQKIPFDMTQVYPLSPTQRMADVDTESQAGRLARQFAFLFTKLLKAPTG